MIQTARPAPTRPLTPSAAARARRAAFCAVFALCAVWATPGRAQSNEAQTLFDSGVADMLAGRYDAACPAIRRSYELDPLPGVAFTLAECLAGAGKPLAALKAYDTFRGLTAALPAARREVFAEREQLAIAKSARLNERIPDLELDVPSNAPSTLVVKRNGEVLDPTSYGERMRLEPGDYSLVAENADKVVWERHVHLAEASHVRVSVPWAAPPPIALEPARSSNGPRRELGAKEPDHRLAYAAGITGAAGMVVGITAGAIAWNRKGDIERECPADSCTASGQSAVHSARAAATVSTIGFGVGLAGLAGAVVLWLIPRGSDTSIRTAVVTEPHGASFHLGGVFQ